MNKSNICGDCLFHQNAKSKTIELPIVVFVKDERNLKEIVQTVLAKTKAICELRKLSELCIHADDPNHLHELSALYALALFARIPQTAFFYSLKTKGYLDSRVSDLNNDLMECYNKFSYESKYMLNLFSVLTQSSLATIADSKQSLSQKEIVLHHVTHEKDMQALLCKKRCVYFWRVNLMDIIRLAEQFANQILALGNMKQNTKWPIWMRQRSECTLYVFTKLKPEKTKKTQKRENDPELEKKQPTSFERFAFTKQHEPISVLESGQHIEATQLPALNPLPKKQQLSDFIMYKLNINGFQHSWTPMEQFSRSNRTLRFLHKCK